MRFIRFQWAAYISLGVLIGFAAAAHRSGMLPQLLRAQEPAGQKGKPPDAKAAPKLQALESLPKREAPFKGDIDRNVVDPKPDFPKEVKAPNGAPNVLLIMTD